MEENKHWTFEELIDKKVLKSWIVHVEFYNQFYERSFKEISIIIEKQLLQKTVHKFERNEANREKENMWSLLMDAVIKRYLY